MKNYHLDLIKVTESAAIAASQWVGRGNKEEADRAATDAMRDRLNQMDFAAQISIGEGKKDGSYGLYQDELVGVRQAETIEYSIAVDPIEGTTPTAKGGTEAMSVIALANIGCFYETDIFYMDKIAVGPDVGHCSLDSSPLRNVNTVANALGKSPQHITVCVLDRPRTGPLIAELRKIGCRIKFISDCDVTACIATCVPDSGVDMYWSVGGSPESVIAAAAMKCMGGRLQCREVILEGTGFYPHGHRTLEIEDLVNGPCMFAATGITDGQLLKGVRFSSSGPITNSIAMRSESGTIRHLITHHKN